jgi:hypothetical protein
MSTCKLQAASRKPQHAARCKLQLQAASASCKPHAASCKLARWKLQAASVQDASCELWAASCENQLQAASGKRKLHAASCQLQAARCTLYAAGSKLQAAS